MRVALLHPCFWPEVRRGSERFARDLADGLIARGHEPRLITSHPARRTSTVEDGLPIVRNRRPPEGHLRARLYTEYLTHLPATYASLARGHDDLAHALYPTDAVAAAIWSSRSGRPTVFTAPGPARREAIASRRLRLETIRRAGAQSTAVVAISQYARDSLWRWLGIEARVIHQGVDTRAFVPSSERDEAPTVFCAADPGDPRKRVALLVRAFRGVRRRNPGARLVLIRPHDGGHELEEEGVRLLEPTTDRGELAGRYGRAWVSVLPARQEGFGLVVAESLACGTPVVGTREGAIPELLDDPGVGGLFTPDDEDDLARAIHEALDAAGDPATTERCRARGEQLSVERCVEKYDALYAELIGRG